jgi:imidazolonepropionase
MTRTPVDLLIVHADEIATPAGPGPRRGRQMDELRVVADGALAVRDGRVVALGPTAEIEAMHAPTAVHDARGCFVVPGFVDAHTHPVFVGTREHEFDLRLRGVGYEEITRRGGGIFRSVDDLRAADDATLAASVRGHLRRFLAAGTTTVEARAATGSRGTTRAPLARAPCCARRARRSSRRCASCRRSSARTSVRRGVPRPARRLRRRARPRDDPGRRARRPRALLRRLLRRRRRSTSPSRGRSSRRRATTGSAARVHADELAPSGGARLAAELGAASADHLVHVDDAAIAAMGEAGVAPVLLPGTVFSLGLERSPPARAMVERGLAVAIASDFNPGTSCLWSPLLVVALACQVLHLTIAEALTAATANAAASLGLGSECGALLPGMSADAVLIRGEVTCWAIA